MFLHFRENLGLASLAFLINFDFRNVIFQSMVFPFVRAKYKWKFMRDRCKLSVPRPLAALPLAPAFSRGLLLAQIGELARRLPFSEKSSHGSNSLLEGKQRSGTLKRKDISFLNDVLFLFFLTHCVVSHSARCFIPCDRFSTKGPLISVGQRWIR